MNPSHIRGPAKMSRYTSLPECFDLLKTGKLVFHDPTTWEDKNDSELMLLYKKRRRIPNLHAICFSLGDETIHHWKAYASGISGCCIEFDGPRLMEAFEGIQEIRSGEVKYRKISEIRKEGVDLLDLPYTKRWPYRNEEEFRILWEGHIDELQVSVDIDIRAIRKITLSQLLPISFRHSMKEMLYQELRGTNVKVNISTVYRNRKWIKMMHELTRP